MTPNKEDYIKAIYRLGGRQRLVPNKEIAAELGIAPASVSEMLLKLQKLGLVHYRPYKGTTLTHRGMDDCLQLVRSHRLWEVFLIRHLGYSWSEAHEDAHLLEHVSPLRMTERLDRFLNHPAFCPHGSAIPQGGELADLPALRPLDSLEPGQQGRVLRVEERRELLDRLQALGVTIGARVELLSQDGEGGELRVLLDGEELCLSQEMAAQIYLGEMT